ncbi:hypothetical protein L21SP5_01720 [Salinivirga cyanobacteriivorans]|uniref:Uncharacterized protein n=1 Tax=Salinivirga cyanobacteriivorans TaxID=1307839 RepID=A0A0S2HZD8_9BACT|nr:hypothetical protein [Salinivirga cyanobacteriivorans]ALO15362.1 hypothetical protein L21SP5_01720 [Salinivirga cyanobacteriivorans]
MKKIKELILIVTIFLGATFALFATQDDGSADNALSDDDPNVTCRCTWFGDNCSAGGWGFICTPYQECWHYSRNC